MGDSKLEQGRLGSRVLMVGTISYNNSSVVARLPHVYTT